MRNYIARRLLLLVPIMLGVSFLTFAMFRIIPGDAAVLTCGFGCTDKVVEDLRHERGLDRPAIVPHENPWELDFWNELPDTQYVDWLWGIVQPELYDQVFGVSLGPLQVPGPKLDLGQSLTESELPVSTGLERRLPVTAELLVMAIILSLVLGIPPGVLSAIRPGTPLDFIARIASVLWLSIPSFWLGILVITFGLVWFDWTPPQLGEGYVSFFDNPWTNVQQFFFPSLVLALAIAAAIMRLTRSSMLEVLRNDYIRTAWSKGLRERTVVIRHALKNALIPVVTVVGLQVGALIGGAVLVEQVFAIKGVGFWVVESVIRRDIFVVMSLTLIFAVAFVVANLIVDVAYAWLDPRIRYG